jgi:hypothetical protein
MRFKLRLLLWLPLFGRCPTCYRPTVTRLVLAGGCVDRGQRRSTLDATDKSGVTAIVSPPMIVPTTSL